ncbi:MAG: hypothetical protein AAGA62_12360, partial [Bacteroidota bacterium]
GKTQTNYPWSSWDSTFTAEPHLWHHEVFYPDGRPYREAEAALIRNLTNHSPAEAGGAVLPASAGE